MHKHILMILMPVFASFSRFTQNLSVFRRDINDSLKAPSSSSNNSIGQMNDMMG